MNPNCNCCKYSAVIQGKLLFQVVSHYKITRNTILLTQIISTNLCYDFYFSLIYFKIPICLHEYCKAICKECNHYFYEKKIEG